MSDDTDTLGSAPFGLTWGLSRKSVRERFSGLTPGADAEHALTFPLNTLAERIWSQGGFCPGVFLSSPERNGDEVTFEFARDRLHAVFLRFGYGFGQIGQDPDTLSEQAMTIYARAEFHKLIYELSVKYGSPDYVSEQQARAGAIHVQGIALFGSENHGQMQLMFGHDGGSALMGEIWHHSRKANTAGF